MIRRLSESSQEVLELEFSGKITGKDMDGLEPVLDDYFDEFEDVRILVILKDITGFDSGGLLKEFKLGWKCWGKKGKIAVVGQKKWEELSVKLEALFQKADEKYFDIAKIEEARDWLKS